MVPSALAPRSAATMPTARTSRFGEIGSGPSQLNNDDFPSLGQGLNTNSSSKTWGPKIWRQVGSGQRDGSQARDTDSFYNSPTDTETEGGRQGSSSLLDKSDPDGWASRSRPWNSHDNSSTMVSNRVADVSPSRTLTQNASQPSHTYSDLAATSHPYFNNQRAGSLAQQSRPSGQPQLNPASNTFSLGLSGEGASNGFGGLGRLTEQETQNHRLGEQHVGPWGDSATFNSPADDRRGMSSASDYHPSHSNAPSRSGSLPPSRQGNGVDALGVRHAETYPLFPQQPMQLTSRAQHATFPQSHRYAERSGSIQSDVAYLSRLNIDDDPSEHPNGGYHSHRPSVSVNGVSAHPHGSAYDATHQHKQSNHVSAFDHVHPSRDSVNDTVSLARAEAAAFNGSGTFTPNGLPNHQLMDQSFQNFRFNGRGAATPSNGDFRTSPYYPSGTTPQYSTGATPPSYDHLYPSRGEHGLRSGARQSNVTLNLVNQRLRNIEQQQEPHMIPQNFQQMVPTGPFRSSYSHYQYSLPQNVMFNPSVLPGMMTGADPPRGPRDQNPTDTYRSQVLEDFKLNHKTSRKYELKDIYGHIVEFSGDQHGSRFIQGKLETANSDEKERVFKELLSDSLQLMQDVFGNYVIQKFFEHGDQTQKRQLADRMKGHIYNLSMQMYGCRVVQKALEHVLTDQQASMVKELEQKVIVCVRDQNGNHVIQKAIERVPPEHIQFVLDAFTGQAASLAGHSYGCRVIQRMLEYCQPPAKAAILQELHASLTTLITCSYGNYVVQHIIELGDETDRERVLTQIKSNLVFYSKHKFASNVVEKTLIRATYAQRRGIMLKLVEKTGLESSLPSLIKDSYGNYVIQKLLEMLNDEDYTEFVEYLRPEMEKAKKLGTGKNIQQVEKKMHRLENGVNNSDDTSVENSASTTNPVTATTPPPLVKDSAQSPESTSIPSTTNSTVGDPIQGVSAKTFLIGVGDGPNKA